MSKCADIRGELGKVHLLYLKSKVNGDTIDLVSKNVRDLTQSLVNKYQDTLNENILNEFYNSVEKIFKGYNGSNRINVNFLKGTSVPVQGDIEQVVDQGTYMDVRFKGKSNSDSDASKDVDLKKVNTEEDLLDIFNGSNEMYGSFIKRFNTDILNMVLFGFNSEGGESFNNSIDQLNKNIQRWLHENTDEFNQEFDDQFSKINSNIAASKLIDITDDGKDSLYRKFISRHFDKIINITDNKIIRKNKKSGIYEPKISSSIRTGWTNNEFISAFDELGDFVKSVVESRNVIDINGNETGNTLNWSQIFMSIGKLQQYVDRTNNYYLDDLITDIVNAKKNGKNTGKIVKESKILNDISIDELNTLNSLYIHFFNKDKAGFTSKNKNIYHSFYVRSLNSYKDSNARNSNIIDYYDLVKYNFEKQLTNKYSQVVYDYEKGTFVQEDLNTIRTNKQRSMYVNGLNMYKDLFDYETLPDKIKEISDKFDLIKTNNNGVNGYSLKYKNVEIFNTDALSTFDLSILKTEEDYQNMNKMIDYIITVNPTIIPSDYLKYALQSQTSKKESDFDKMNLAYKKVLLPITNRVLSIIGNEKMNFFSESATQDSSGYKYAITEYAKWLDVISGDNIKAVTKTANDTFVPSFGQINMVKEPGTLISFLKKSLQKNKYKKSPIKSNLFMQGQNHKALGDPITDTFIYFKGEAIPIAKAGSTELFVNHFMIKYLFNIGSNDYNIQVQPTTYSDKSKQTSAVIDSKNVIDYSTEHLQPVADKDIAKMKHMLLNSVSNYYQESVDHVLNTVNTALGQKFKTLNSLQEYLSKNNIKSHDVIKAANDKGLYIFSTMFFEGDKINSLLMELDKDPHAFAKLIEQDLQDSIKMIESENIYLDYKMFKPTIDVVLNGKYGEKFGTTSESFEKDWVDPITNRIIMKKGNKINPLYERYFYERNIYSENYRNLLAGSLAMHPAKGGAETFQENAAKRYVAQTKRTVGMQGTIHPYRLGMYNGLPYYEKIAFVKDPKMALFNQLGNNHDQEVTDGSSFSLFLSTILKNNSLLDQGGQIHHKSLGMLIEPQSGSFMLMKHADHSITNERLRNSKYAEFNLNNVVRKMLNQPIGYNIDLTKDFNGKSIYKPRSASYRYDGSIYTILDIIKDENSGPNNYKFIVEETDGTSTNKEEYSVPIDSLYDLWSMLGGENSITIDYSTGDYKYDNSSWYNLADFVNKVGFYKNEKSMSEFIKKNNITNYKDFRKQITDNRYDDDSSIEYEIQRPTADSIFQPLKNKFISQITFTTSQKVGAVNPNPTSSLADDTPFMTFNHYSSIYTGLQLDHEHHTDDSDITEPTQILSAILFDGDASQYNRQLKLGIKMSIANSIANYLKTNPELKNIDFDKLKESISSNFLNELKKKDLSNFASSVCMNIQNTINKILSEANIKLDHGDINKYNELNAQANAISRQVPFSDPGLYNAFINIMNSTFTSLAIRRKIDGSMNILSPQNYFITVHEKDGKVMIGEEFDGQLSYTPISKANVRMFDKVRITRVNKKKFNIYDKNDRVNRSKLNNKKYIKDVFINVDYGFSVFINVPNYPRLQGVIHYDDNKKRWDINFHQNDDIKQNELTAQDIELIDSWNYADFNEKQNLIDKFIPKDLQHYYTSGEYQKRNLELAKLPYGTYKSDPKLYDQISPDSVIRDKWGIYFINEYNDGVNNLLNSEEYYDVTLPISKISDDFIEQNLIEQGSQKKAQNWFKKVLPSYLDNNTIDEQSLDYAKKLLELINNDKLLQKNKNELSKEFSDLVNNPIPYLRDIRNRVVGIETNLMVNKKIKNDGGNDASRFLSFVKNLGTNSFKDINRIIIDFAEYSLNPEFSVKKQDKNKTIKLLNEFINKYQNEVDSKIDIQELDLKDYNAFQEFRNLEGDFTVEKINGAARRLLPHRVMFSFDGQNQVDYYSLDSANLINYFNYIKSLDKGSDLYKLKTQEYLYIIKRSISDFNLTHPLMSSIISKIENGLNAESELTDKEFNILKNIQSMYFKMLKENSLANRPIYDFISNIESMPREIASMYRNNDYASFFNSILQLDVKTPIYNYNEEPAEVMMPANLGKKFMIKENDNINDIDSNVMYNRLIQQYNTFDLPSLGINSQGTVLEYSGNNIHVLSEQDINKIKSDPKLSKLITPSYKYNGDVNGKYIIDPKTGEQTTYVGSLQFYNYRKGNKTFKLVSAGNENDLKLLNGFNDKRGNSYSILLNNDSYKEQLQSYSLKLYNNFKASLIGAMCRIPSQAKQSGMPFKVVGFIKTENNVAFVPAENLWLTGGDYDIDKIVQALLSFDDNGMIKKYNPYFIDTTSEHIIESLALPVPDNITREVVYSEKPSSSYVLSKDAFHLLESLENAYTMQDFSTISISDFKKITQILNDIVNSDSNTISINEQVGEQELFQVNTLLKNMFVNGYKLLSDQSVLENVIVGTMIHAYKDGRNALHTYAPMDSENIKTIAKKSSKGAIMAKFSPMNPVTDILMQMTNMVGKDGIAIAATGQKALSIIIDRYLKIKSGDFKNIAFQSDLANLVSKSINEPEEDDVRIINGFDLKGIGQNLAKFFRENFDDDQFKVADPSGELSNKEYWIKNKIEALFDESNNSLNVSELITLATDNAKELVLDKINASVDTLGMYIYAIAMGVDIKKFTRFMTMPIIDKLIKLSKSNVINPERKESSIQSAIKDIQNGYLDTGRYSKYIDYKHASSILQAIEPNLFRESNISDHDASKLFKGLFNPLSLQDIKDKQKLEAFNNILDSIKSKLEKGEIKTLKILKNIQSYSEDYDDFGGYDDVSDGGGTVDIAVSFNRWYQDSKNMIGTVSDDDVQLVNLFERIKNESNALKVLGQVLGINQKIKTEEYDFYKYNNVLSNFLNPLVNKKLEKLIQEYSTKKKEEVVDYFSLEYQALYNNGQGFSFIDFISDPDYKEQAIQEYGKLTDKSQLNILEILSSSEHFMEMVSLTYYLSENVFKTSSAKYRTLNSIINRVEQDRIFGHNGNLPKSISKDVYLKLSNYVDDIIVNSFLSQNNGLKIKINGGDPYSYITENEIVKSKKRGSSEDVDLSTYEGRSKFTSWFENIIRNIQINKQFRDKDGVLYKNESFNNAFINNIIPEYKRDMLTEEDYGIMKPSISIGVNMTMQDAALKQKMVEGLKQLKNVTYNGHNMLDLIFLYDLIVNRGKKNQQSFAGFIAEAYPLDDIRLVANQYVSYLKDIDASGISFDYNKNDFLLRGIAEKESTKPSPGGIYYQQYYDPSENKIKRNYIQDGNVYQVTLNSMSKNIPLNGVYKQKPMVDPNIIVSINNSDVKITIKC